MGIQEFSTLSRNSIGSKQDTAEVVFITEMYQKINKISDTAWDDFADGTFDAELKQAMAGETVLNENVLAIAKIL